MQSPKTFTPPSDPGAQPGAPARLSERQRPPGSTEERLVADLIALMEAGQAPWRRPWREGSGAHVNLITGRPYRGSNPVLLTLGLHLRGSTLPYWCGWGEARRLDLAPRRGSRGVMILRPLRWEREPVGTGAVDGALGAGAGAGAGATAAHGESGTPAPMPQQGIRFRPMVVFNAADLVGDAQASRGLAERIAGCRAQAQAKAQELGRQASERLAAAAATLAAWPVPLFEGAGRACYRPDLDRIELPDRGSFHAAAARLATWAHEAIHSTGHPSRLARDLTGAFGSAAYAREELVAELGAVLLGERLAIGSDTANHAAYLRHWCELLRQDSRLLLQVLGDARRAADLIAPEAAISPEVLPG
jgi:antirestriction protein ArdC